MSDLLMTVAKVIVVGMGLFLLTTFCVIAVMVIRELWRMRR